MSITRTSW